MGDLIGVLVIGIIAFCVGAGYGHQNLADTISADCSNKRGFKLANVNYDCLPLSFEREGKQYQIILEPTK
ncbi:hypothetical protein pf16_32 [Pseudomonas phage pf16]|uniref:Uncharacterized protein n=1 Tax=Pseudomonas phage pf16 TaxID=1815630 RepID=A0A1S5R3R6_9CAUD|nr:hypothetical protein FDG98_gp031 [Pseudomonas phage pf16]AND74955.1 hypothetical protein pf16_32 [Pseudomonas phage pf16]